MGRLRDRLQLAAEYLEMCKRRPLLLFEMTSRCNLHCQFCYNVWKGPGPYPTGELFTGEVIDMLEAALRGSGGRHVTFTGGEPLLRDDLGEVIAHLHARDISTTVITNGYLLTAERARELVCSGVGLFEVPLLSTDRDINNTLTGTDSFDRTLDAIANIRLAGGRVAAVFVATRLNIHQWEETIKLALSAGVAAMVFNRFNPGGEGARNAEALAPSMDELREALSIADRAVSEWEMPIGIPVPIPPCTIDQRDYPHLRFHGCLAGTSNAYWTIDPVGNVRPCNHSPTILGNVLREPWEAITAPGRLSPWLSSVPSSCRQCEHIKRCRGGCRAAAEVCGGGHGCEDPFVCRAREEEGVPA